MYGRLNVRTGKPKTCLHKYRLYYVLRSVISDCDFSTPNSFLTVWRQLFWERNVCFWGWGEYSVALPSSSFMLPYADFGRNEGLLSFVPPFSLLRRVPSWTGQHSQSCWAVWWGSLHCFQVVVMLKLPTPWPFSSLFALCFPVAYASFV